MDIADIFYANFSKMENRKEHPILFSTPMVQAIIDGRKTMTRRLVKPQPENHYFQSLVLHASGLFTFCPNGNYNPKPEEILQVKCPYGQPGDLLWVREKFMKNNTPTGYPFHYYADDETFTNKDSERWKPSLHMPKAAARIWLELTNVRVERLIDITNADALAEGIIVIEPDEAHYDYMQESGSYLNPIGSFFSLWRKINGDESLEGNPWVWVIEFKRIEPCR